MQKPATPFEEKQDDFTGILDPAGSARNYGLNRYLPSPRLAPFIEHYWVVRLDGASEWQVATRVILPLSWPGFLTVGLVAGLGAYSELLFAVTFLIDVEKMPVATSFLQFSTGYSQLYNLVNAAGVIIVLPLIILFLLMQRRFIAGLAASGSKG